jgi:hypothetical protein
VTIDEIIQMTENRLAFLQQHREYAFGRGDMSAVTAFDADILTTQETLDQLLSL